jgi:hypothetical protein
MSSYYTRFAATCILAASNAFAVAADRPDRDLELSAIFQELISPNNNCPSGLSGKLSGYGEAKELGQIAFLSADCFSQNNGSFTFTDGKLKILTSTGDLLFADYSGQVVVPNNSTHGVLNAATFQIRGGTGKYKKATGGGEISGTEDLTTGLGTIQLKGTINHKK